MKHLSDIDHGFPKNFLSDFDSDLELLQVVGFNSDPNLSTAFWKTIICLDCIDEKGTLFTIHIREAWDEKVFFQDLYDQSWTLTELLRKPKKGHSNRKVIIYLCHSFPKNRVSRITHQLPTEFIRGRYWKQIKHLYIDIFREKFIVNKLIQILNTK